MSAGQDRMEGTGGDKSGSEAGGNAAVFLLVSCVTLGEREWRAPTC